MPAGIAKSKVVIVGINFVASNLGCMIQKKTLLKHLKTYVETYILSSALYYKYPLALIDLLST